MSTKTAYLEQQRDKLLRSFNDTTALCDVLDDLAKLRFTYSELNRSGICRIIGQLSKHVNGSVAIKSQDLMLKFKSQIAKDDPVRCGAIETIRKALRTASDELACEIERFTYLSNDRSTSSGYRDRIRTLAYNLSCAGSDVLRSDVVDKHISARELCDMSTEELAPDYIKATRERMKERTTAAAITYQPVGIKGLFICKRCHSDETISTEMQTRSADEPMTIFIQCVKCKNRWRK